jgi:hypothetical protein
MIGPGINTLLPTRTMVVSEFHIPSALDRLFFVFDRAAGRMSLPGAFLQAQLELAGQLDVEGLRRALACLHRIYPATAGRLEWSNYVSRPCWKLNAWTPDVSRLVSLHHLEPPTESELARQIDRLAGCRLDLRTLAPVQFHVFRGLPTGDLLVMRWPHAFMDARGGFVLLDEIDRLYRAKPDPTTLTSAGDELLDGLSHMTSLRNSPAEMPAGRVKKSAGREDLQLPTCPEFRDLGPLRCAVRNLDNDQCRQSQEIAARTCSPARFGAFLRACAVRALHRVLGRHASKGSGYSVPYILEGRDAPYRSPVCRNAFTMQRLFVPAEVAADRAATARLLHEGTRQMVAAGPDLERLKRSLRMTCLPTMLLAHLVRHSLMYPPEPWQRDEFGRPPSLPMGFMQAFGQEKRSFCGPDVRYAHAFRPPLPRQGIGIQVVAEQGRLAICGMSYEVRLTMMNRLLDDLADALLSPD